MQVVAASAIPILGNLLGVINPADMGPVVLSWIGYIAIAVVTLRLICAPYYVWKEQAEEAEQLKVELDLPSFREKQKLSDLIAEKRMNLLETVSNMQIAAIYQDEDQWQELGKKAYIIASQIGDSRVDNLLYDYGADINCRENIVFPALISAIKLS